VLDRSDVSAMGGAVPGREWVRPASTIAAGVLAAAALGKVGLPEPTVTPFEVYNTHP